ncbi:CHAT domain-containing protein [Nostoc favosum]|uniref:CHAT domain-containing protein n=1 Tax=Nostoc favosum CHAB5714 TaxID=2780399 RepID=A0ABS8IA27_9NOSO|nr:CHAT domain-containing protein [Nostoc favosum]MCC5600634.1 CHAT domain-containing protein [Nostoc favosum CHAB5714]
MFSFDSQSLYEPNNRLLVLRFRGATPYKIHLADQPSENQITASFGIELDAGAHQKITIELDYRILLQRQISNTIFLVASHDRPNVPWQGAVAAAASWVDRVETCHSKLPIGSKFHRFAPFLWFDNEKPLPDQVFRFLHNTPNLQRIVVIGKLPYHDLENLLTALLDKGVDAALRLQIFTDDEYYRDLVNVLRGNIQARMIMADEVPERIHQIEAIVAVSVVPNPNLLPLKVRQFIEEITSEDFFTRPVCEQSAFIISADVCESPSLGAVCIPMARYLGASVLLWSRSTENEILTHLERKKIKQIFLVGKFSETDEDLLRLRLEKELNLLSSQKNTVSSTQPVKLIRIPYHDAISASAVIAHLFKAQRFLDWLIQELTQEKTFLDGEAPSLVKKFTHDYIAKIEQRPWAVRLVQVLNSLLNGEIVESEKLLSAYQDIFIGRTEFVRLSRQHFAEVAATNTSLLESLSPIWNDMVVLCDFDPVSNENLNLFPAACFAAFHKASLLLFPAISKEKEDFLDKAVRRLENQFAAESTRKLQVALVYEENIKHKENIARLVFPFDVLAALEVLKPLTVALYSTDVRVPYEVIADGNRPIFLNHAVGHLTGTDPYETALITASSILYIHELQRQKFLKTLFCMVNIPGLGKLKLEEEYKTVKKILDESKFDIDSLFDEQALKPTLIKELAKEVHIFHYAGHGTANQEQPQRSAFVLYPSQPKSRQFDPLTALEIKYHIKLGAHPFVFLNTCFGSSNNRIPEDSPQASELREEADLSLGSNQLSQTSKSSEQIMGVASSFMHRGASAVMAPLWEIWDDVAIEYAQRWYGYLQQGCSIGESALLAKMDFLSDSTREKGKRRIDYRVLCYVVWGDPTLRIYPLSKLIKNHPETVERLLQLKTTLK